MVKHWIKVVVVLFGLLSGGQVLSVANTMDQIVVEKKQMVLGVLSFRPEAVTRAQWQPLMDYLRHHRNCSECQIILRPLGYEGLEQALQEGSIDLVLTNPAHYILLRERMNLKMSGPLVTVTRQQNGRAVNQFGGVIFTRADNTHIYQLTDLVDVSIAMVTRGSLGGYQMQVYELLEAGVDVPRLSKQVLTGMPHDKVVYKVLANEAEVGFVRTGVLEAMIAQGVLSWQDIRIINSQATDYHFVHSTPLYPEWPVLALPSVSERQSNSLTVALLQLNEADPAAQAAGIEGFTRPRNYADVESVMRTLRVAPFDAPIETRLEDIWQQYSGVIIGFLVLLVLLSFSLGLILAMNRHLTRQRKLAYQANQAKSEFLANMSHEIRTPMNGVLGLTDQALQEVSLPKMRQKVKRAHQSAELLLGILNDILDFSKIEAGQLTLEQQPFLLRDLVAQLHSLYQPMAEQKGLGFNIHLQDGLERGYVGDAMRLRQVLNNLIANAIKFTQHGKIDIWVEPTSQEGLCFVIEDTGMGMSAEQCDRLFNAFSQADTSITRRFGGTGLGLAISQSLVQVMGGNAIEVESQQNKGSRFRFCVELNPASVEELNALSVSHERQQAAQRFSGRVLLVEDNEINQEVASDILRQFGLDVSWAENGAKAVEKFKIQSFDVVLMDIQMPVMGGYEATRLIREFNADVPIIALTAAATVEDRNKALMAGMNDHLMKPIDKQALQVCLSRYLIPQEFPQSPLVLEKPSLVVPASEIVKANMPTEQKGRVLIVDDQPSNLKVLANGLKAEYLIQAADSGEKALTLAERTPRPDVILLDIVMPDMDGYAVIKALKNNPKTQAIPVMFVTALDGASDEQKGIELGAVDYITKPFKMPVVKARVRSQILLKQKTDLLEHESHIDGLTGIANRRQFDETLQIEGQRLIRSHQPLGIIMVDIDFFKPFNDNYGHGKGDECLVKVAQALQSVFRRPADLLARYGGEEFVAILPETDRQGVHMMAEKMCQAVRDLNLPHGYSAVEQCVTVSLGGISRRVDTLEDVKQLLRFADQALYQAKEQGRNQVVIHGI